jgi:dihydroflavonol-4-reductase
MKIFVTGGTGFVGINLLDALTTENHDIRVLVRPSSPVERLPAGVTTVTGDVTEPSSYQNAIEWADIVVHLAAMIYGTSDEKDKYTQVNFGSTRELLQNAESGGVERFVFLSTAPAHPQTNDTHTGPYVQSKRRCNKLFFDSDISIKFNVMYPVGIMGAKDYRLIRYNLFNRVESNLFLFPPLYMPGVYNIIHVDDVVQAILSSFRGQLDEQVLITGQNMRSSALHRKISSICSDKCRIIPVPQFVTNQVLVRAVNALHDRGFFPERVSPIEQREKVVPDSLTAKAPVSQKSIEDAIRDAYDWYSAVGVLE